MNKYLSVQTREVNVTFENGLYHSVLKPGDGLINDLIEAVKVFKPGAGSILTAQAVGYDRRAVVLKTSKGILVMLNPQIVLRSGTNGKHYKKVRLTYCSTGGRVHSVKFSGGFAKPIQIAMELLGDKI